MTPNERDTGVDFARGARDYVHSADMMRAAPSAPGDGWFEFRFRSLVRRPGAWVASDGAGAAERSAAASLSLRGGGHVRTYLFVATEAGRPLARRPDFETGITVDAVDVAGPLVSGTVSGARDFWPQVADCLRHGGRKMFGIEHWLTLGVSCPGAALGPLPVAEARLLLELQGIRGVIHRIRYCLEGVPGLDGRLLCAPRGNDPGGQR